MYCTSCGKEVEDNAKFCGACGAKVEVPEIAEVPEPETPAAVNQNEVKPAKSKKGLIIALIITASVLLIGAIVGIGLKIYFDFDAKYKDITPGVTNGTEAEPDATFKVGENVYADYYRDDETMVIRGNGDMGVDYPDSEWYDLKEEVEILKIEEGVTAVQECNGFSELEKIYIPSSVERFGIQCFAYNGGLDSSNVVDVYYNGTQEEFYMIEEEATSGKGAFWGTNCEFHFTEDETERPEPTSIPGAEQTREAYIFGTFGSNGYTVYDDEGTIVTVIPNGSKVRLIKSEQRPFIDIDTYYDWWYIEYNGVYTWVVEFDIFEIGKEFNLFVNAEGGLFLRSGPGQDFNSLALVDNGDIVTVIAVEENMTANGHWAMVRTSSGLEGYCSADYLANEH